MMTFYMKLYTWCKVDEGHPFKYFVGGAIVVSK